MSHDDQDLKEMIRKEWNNSSYRYDRQHAHGIQTEEERKAWINLFTPITLNGPLDILDVGCGTGEISILLAEMGHNVSGIDLSEGMLAKAKEKVISKKVSASFTIGDAEMLQVDDNSFDLVINRHLLWTLPHPQKALSEWKRVLRPNGILTVIDGLWRTGSYLDSLRRTASNLAILVTERKNQFKRHYSPELIQSLPHPYGMDSETALSYIKNVGFHEIEFNSLHEIMDIQRRHMPLSRRISFQMPYYLIKGKKSVK